METQVSGLTSVVVDTLVDEDNGSLVAGDVSLREALKAVGDGGTIRFADSLATADAGFGQGVIGLTLGALAVNKSLTITGLGRDVLTVSGTGTSSVFVLDDGDSAQRSDVVIEQLSVVDGAGAGGIVTAGESLRFRDGQLLNNQIAIATQQGAIANVLLKRSLLFNNEGTGIATSGALKLIDSRIFNTAGTGIEHSGTLSLKGSGVANSEGSGVVSEGTVELLSSQIEGSGGNGIENVGFLAAQNVSISGNDGSGIVSIGDLQLSNSEVIGNALDGITFSGSLSLTEASIANNAGDGIAQLSGDGSNHVSVVDSFISGNAGSNQVPAVDFPGPSNLAPTMNPDTQPKEAAPAEALLGTDDSERIFGTDQDDVIKGLGADDVLKGKMGNDTIEGGNGDDALFGGTGDDILGGGQGEDVLKGGGGRDTFVFGQVNEGLDTILDFRVGHDLLDLSGILSGDGYGSATPFESFVQLSATADGAQTIVSVRDVTSASDEGAVFREIALVDQVAIAELDASSFVL
ncbi:MAG: type I secretion C-terminal target domain-containing protein [Cyanobacteria bacterium J06606_4]